MVFRRLLDTASRALPSPSAVRPERRIRIQPGRAEIAVRGVHLPGSRERAARLEAALHQVEGVRRAEVNAVLGLATVFLDEDAEIMADDLHQVIEDAETRYGWREEEFSDAVRPGDDQAMAVEALLAGTAFLGSGLALAGKAVRVPRLPSIVPTLVALADTTPQVRSLLDRVAGRHVVDSLAVAGGLLTQVLAQQPMGLAVEGAQRLLRLSEAYTHWRVWNTGFDALDALPGSHRAPAHARAPRPVPLPPGPVERLAGRTPYGLILTGGVWAATRSPLRAQGTLHSLVPKAAFACRDAFAVHFARVASGRDIPVADPRALRRLDRVDTVVIDADALRTGEYTLEEIIPLVDGLDLSDLDGRARALLDPRRPRARRSGDGWSVAPLRSAEAAALEDERVGACAARGGVLVALRSKERLVAALVLVEGLDPYSEMFVAAAGRVGEVQLAGRGRGLERRLPVTGRLPGADLTAVVRGLQAEGRGLTMVSRRHGEVPAAADVGVGLLDHAGVPPWGAHVFCRLDGACLVTDAVTAARDAARRGARIASIGCATAATAALVVRQDLAFARARLVMDGTRLVALGTGIWTAAQLTRRPAPHPLDRTPWHAWPVGAVLDRLGSSREGLPAHEAEKRRTAASAEEPPEEAGLLRRTLQELDNPLTPALATGASVSAVIGSAVDAGLIGVVLGLSAVMSGVQRVAADRAVRRLVERVSVPVRLRRPEGEQTAAAERLVSGDVIMLAAGDMVPADCRVVWAAGLEADEASLTGESQLVAKTAEPAMAGAVADRTSMLYRGTNVAAGEAIGVVVATGAGTEIDRTLALVTGASRPGGVESRLEQLTKVTLPTSLGAGMLLLGAGLLRGRGLNAVLGSAIGLAVAAVPEGLPFVATAAELATARRLSRQGALVRSPVTIEALGRVDVLCFDKTGTLTEGRLRLGMVSDGVQSHTADELPPGLREVVAAALRATPEGKRLAHPTDVPLAKAAARLDVGRELGAAGWRRAEELPFEPARGYHAALGEGGEGPRLSVKGSPEVVLEACATWAPEGEPEPFDETARKTVLGELERLAGLGHRVLAVAEGLDPASAELRDLCFRGLLGLADPVRPTAAQAVGRLTAAGIRVCMITGDHPVAATALAAELGLVEGGEGGDGGRHVMTGVELDALNDDELAARLPEAHVYARMSPAQKVRIVEALRRAGHVVAVTGDGANDAPAIRLADVGIALGTRATPAARDTADIVISDDRVETIVAAIAQCRGMWKSTRDALALLLGGNLGEIAFTAGAGLLLGGSPLNVRQLLLVNLFTDLLPAMALAVRAPGETAEEALLAEGPEESLGEVLNRDIAVRAVTTAVSAQTAWFLSRLWGTRGQTDTTALVALVAAQLVQTLLAGGLRNPLVPAASLGSLAALAAVVQTPGLSGLFGCRPLGPHGWLIALGSATALSLLAAVVERMWRVHPDVTSPDVPEGDNRV
ncbi:cation-translocating P-type ATPase [Actinocorallia libanotica]|uniref:Cation-translocating P-type ATPase n=1 Tax=Actinocorallia libanotica TaxID=46162 RepID=A0ABN1QDF2_9ACTN